MERAEEIWVHFKSVPGAGGIASEHAIGGLIKIIKKKKPKKILELGSGMGTLTYAIMASLGNFFGKEFSYDFYTVENDEFCLGQLKKNLEGFEDKCTVINNISEVFSKGIQFDLIVVDGGGNLPDDMGPMNIENMVERKGVIFIEGSRRYQREMIKKWYAGRNYITVNIPAAKDFINWKNERIKNKAYWLLQFEPTLLERINFFLLHLRDKLIGPRRKIMEMLGYKN